MTRARPLRLVDPDAEPDGGPNAVYLRDFARHLRALNRSPRTIRGYTDDVALLARHLAGRDLATTGRADVEEFLGDQLARHRPATAAVRYRSLRRFFNWMTGEELVATSPMAGVGEPAVPDVPVPVIPDDYLLRLLKSMDGKAFEDRRDTAIVRLLIDTPLRLAELAGLRIRGEDGRSDVDLDVDSVYVTGKGARPRANPFGPSTGQALTRYERARAAHPAAKLDAYWIGGRGAMTGSGIYQMVERRARAAGLPHVHPHQFRHTFAHQWRKAGGSEEDLMRLGGWRSREVMARYGESLAVERAADAHKRLAPGERV